MAGISTPPLIVHRALELDHFRSSPNFTVGVFFPQSLPCAFSQALNHSIPWFFVHVFPQFPVALRLRFGRSCGLPSPPDYTLKELLFSVFGPGCEAITRQNLMYLGYQKVHKAEAIVLLYGARY